MNSQLWAWIDQLYHPMVHSSLNGKTPLTVWQNYIEQVKPLGALAHRLDELFYHRVKRKVRKDSSISYEGKIFEVPYLLANKTVWVVVDPYLKKALFVEDEQGLRIGELVLQDLHANRNYKRHKSTENKTPNRVLSQSLVNLALEKQQQQLTIIPAQKKP
jgi:hypothetical protein